MKQFLTLGFFLYVHTLNSGTLQVVKHAHEAYSTAQVERSCKHATVWLRISPCPFQSRRRCHESSHRVRMNTSSLVYSPSHLDSPRSLEATAQSQTPSGDSKTTN